MTSWTTQRLGTVPLDLELRDGPRLPDEAAAQPSVPDLVPQRVRRHPESECRLSEGEHLSLLSEPSFVGLDTAEDARRLSLGLRSRLHDNAPSAADVDRELVPEADWLHGPLGVVTGVAQVGAVAVLGGALGVATDCARLTSLPLGVHLVLLGGGVHASNLVATAHVVNPLLSGAEC